MRLTLHLFSPHLFSIPFFLRLCFGALLCLSLFNCSPSAPPEAEQETSKEEVSDVDDPDQLMLKDGWRYGSLKIEVEVQQVGHSHEKGKTEILSDWNTVVKAMSEEDVLVVEDFRAIVEKDPDPEQRLTALEFEPFYRSSSATEAKLSGSLTHKAHFALSDAESIDLLSSVRDAEQNGAVENLSIKSLHPSLFGKGYEASVELKLKGLRKVVETNKLRSAAEPIVTSEEKEVVETLSFLLFPVPNKGELNDYSYIPELAPEEMKERLKTHNLETLSLLNQLHADTLPAQSQMRAGMLTVATKDELKLAYEYNGEKQLPFIASLESLVGKASPNLLRITITLKAK
ncbi:MAG: hypothetical protein EOP48_15520 [Sphingobacteriales bacterium]|nr:MAG: hypothetical protein EOP48_15520 [Sphingobacteriales bacterium]